MCSVNYPSLNRLQTYTLLTSVHNDADATGDVDVADDADDYKSDWYSTAEGSEGFQLC